MYVNGAYTPYSYIVDAATTIDIFTKSGSGSDRSVVLNELHYHRHKILIDL